MASELKPLRFEPSEALKERYAFLRERLPSHDASHIEAEALRVADRAYKAVGGKLSHEKANRVSDYAAILVIDGLLESLYNYPPKRRRRRK